MAYTETGSVSSPSDYSYPQTPQSSSDATSTPRSPVVFPIINDPWDVHKDLLQRLYIDEGKRLKDVMEYMEKEHSFFASSNMYKKKFRQWRFQTNRKGWRVRTGRQVAVIPTTSSQIVQSPAVYQHQTFQTPVQTFITTQVLELPANLKIHEASIRAVWNDVQSGLQPLLPFGRIPVNSLSGPSTERLQLPSPAILVDFQRCSFSAMELVDEKSNAHLSGAYFQRAFESLEPILRVDYINSSLYILEIMSEAARYGLVEFRFLLLKQLYMSALKVHGRNHVVTVWTNWLLHAPDPLRTELVELLAKVFADALASVLGRYDYTALFNRLRQLRIKSRNGTILPENEWDQLINDCQRSPHTCNALVWNASLYYADAVQLRTGDNAKVEDVVKNFPYDIHKVQKGQLRFADNYALVGGADMYARALASQGKDASAEPAFRLAVAKAVELLGNDNPFTMDCKRNYGEFLATKGRFDELDRIYEEITLQIGQYMPEGNVWSPIISPMIKG